MKKLAEKKEKWKNVAKQLKTKELTHTHTDVK